MENTSLETYGLTKRQINALIKKDIDSVERLMSWTPLRYIDNSIETGLSPFLHDAHAVVIGTMTDCAKDKASTGRKYISIKVIDRVTKERLRIAIFGQYFMFDMYRALLNREVIVCGKLKYDSRFGFSMGSPDTISGDINGSMRVVPVLSKVSGLSEDVLTSSIRKAAYRAYDDPILTIASRYGLDSLSDAYRHVFMPASMAEAKAGVQRLLFNDIFYLAARFVLSGRKSFRVGMRADSTALAEQCIAELPYTLTEGQMSAYMGIRQVMVEGRHLKALVQGDVSCGKTEVAALAMMLAAGNGYQACMMAPTQILAEQHFEKMRSKVEDKGIKCVYVGGGKVTKETRKAIEDGSALIIVGTHALLSPKIKYKNLGVLIIDEEHKFGVAQRQAIEERSELVDVISMSATPIPRTLASAVYGSDTEIFSIHGLPSSRKPVITYYDNGGKVIPFVRRTLLSGHQVYAVCPMIEDTDAPGAAEIMSTHQATAMYRDALGSGFVVEELTGQTSPEDTERILRKFRAGEIHMLVSTTVIEVGVDVPNATLMVIHNAERFGLAGLHQLRGRVGRGSEQSYCVLVSRTSPVENERLLTLCQTNDGFEIAERDMMYLRKSGDVFGDSQSGFNRYIQEMLLYPKLYKKALEIAKTCSNEELRRHVDYMMAMENDKKRGLPKI